MRKAQQRRAGEIGEGLGPTVPELLYLSRSDVEAVGLPVTEVIEAVEEAFRQKARGRAEVPPKPGIHPQPDAFIHAMPALLPSLSVAGIKWVAGFPENYKRGLPYITGLTVLNDPDTGLPLCVMDATWITAMRTGAATAVAARHLAAEGSRVVAILGCGVQGRSNLEALLAVVQEVEEVKAYDTNEGNLARYAREMKAKHGATVIPCSSAREAVENSDIVVTAGPIRRNPRPMIEASWFKDGGFACPLDFDSYWKPEAMHSMDKFCTDDKEQLQYYQGLGYFTDIPAVYAELADLVEGVKPGRQNQDERTMSMNLGLAIEDMATAIRVYRAALARNLGKWLPL